MLWAVHVCRICAQIRETCVPIFEKGLDIKMRRCFATNISKDDLKPKQLCEDCFFKLNDFYSFVILYFASNYRFESLIYESTQLANGTLPTQGCVEIDYSLLEQGVIKAETVESKPLLDCPNLGVQYKDVLPLDNIEVEARDFGEQNILNEIAKTDIDLQNFVSSDNQIYNDIIQNSDEHSLHEQSTSQSLYIHLEQNKLGKNVANTSTGSCQYAQCYYNSNVEEKPNSITRNNKINIISIETVKNETNKSKCNMTKIPNTIIKYRGETGAEENILTVTNSFLNTVETDKSDTKLKSTNRFHKLNKISVTAICEAFKKQQFDYDLQQSRPRTTKPKKSIPVNKIKIKRYPCNICAMSFTRRQCLNEHIRKHNNIRPFICNICKKAFAAQWDLTSHKRIHTNIFSCEHCGKCFIAPSKLQRHIRTHTGERPFVCTVKDCRWSFSDKRNLTSHQLTHTNIRKFTCDICKLSYKTKNQLKDHIQAHSDKHIFKCDICVKSYKWKTNLVHHLKKHTPH